MRRREKGDTSRCDMCGKFRGMVFIGDGPFAPGGKTAAICKDCVLVCRDVLKQPFTGK